MISRPEARCFLVSKDVVVPLNNDIPVVLGRDPTTCNFVLADDRVSRVHAMILCRDGEFVVKDLNSSNGTFVSGRRLSGPRPLRPGDTISIPPFELEFVRPGFGQISGNVGAQTLNTLEARNKLEGSLATLPVADVVQLLNATLQSGILSITDGDGTPADLVLHDGEIVQASYGTLAGEDAVYALLRQRRGHFEFTRTERQTLQARLRAQPGGPGASEEAGSFENQIRRKTQSLLLEGARLMDERIPSTPQLAGASARTTFAGAGDIECLGTITE
jgi:pSer/pThr/pTyr-binding forkhead associated (FHA) protein